LKVPELRTTNASAVIGEFTYEACAECVHGGSFFEEGCAKKVICADTELGIVFCQRFKNKNEARFRRRRKFRRKFRFNVYLPPEIEREGYE
jgi:hypothetical protein